MTGPAILQRRLFRTKEAANFHLLAARVVLQIFSSDECLKDPGHYFPQD